MSAAAALQGWTVALVRSEGFLRLSHGKLALTSFGLRFRPVSVCTYGCRECSGIIKESL
jgi:hypothetical protein